jgi:hypothetical protein
VLPFFRMFSLAWLLGLSPTPTTPASTTSSPVQPAKDLQPLSAPALDPAEVRGYCIKGGSVLGWDAQGTLRCYRVRRGAPGFVLAPLDQNAATALCI